MPPAIQSAAQALITALTELAVRTAARRWHRVGHRRRAAAVGNAVFNATGIRVRDLPITLDRLIG